MNNKKYDERSVIIRNFRNIGICKENEDISQKLLINRTLNKDYLGDLVIILGPNNSGKSNLFKALTTLSSNYKKLDISDEDVPQDFCYDFDDLKSSYLKWNIIEDGLNIDLKKNNLSNDNINKFVDETIKKINTNYLNIVLTPILNSGNWGLYYNVHSKTGNYIQIRSLSSIFVNELSYLTNKDDTRLYDLTWMFDLKKWFMEHSFGISWQSYESSLLSWKNAMNNDLYNEIINFNYSDISEIKRDIEIKVKEDVELNIRATLFEKYGFCVSPKVISYKNSPLSRNDFSIKYNQGFNEFFKKIFNGIDVRENNFKKVIDKAKNIYKNNNISTKYLDKINKKLENLSAKFNKLFAKNDEIYSFDLDNGEEIQFVFSLINTKTGEETAIDYESQSTGFKYVFELFVNLILANNDLKAGDIVLIEEPGVNLDIPGQMELRNILKDFALKTHITVIISNHSPFLVDVDYLEEIRILDNKERKVSITNNYQVIDNDTNNSDTLQNVLHALNAYPSWLIKTKNPKLIFVEGATDYYYLTGIKQYLIKHKEELSENEIELKDLEKLILLPFNGVGKKDEKAKIEATSQIIKDYAPYDCTFIVDGDQAGVQFQKALNDHVSCSTITELLKDANQKQTFKVIEDFIDPKDLENFHLKEKDSNNSATFKKALIINQVEETTKLNLIKLIKAILLQTK